MQQTGAKLADALVKLGYATHDDIMQAMAEFHGMQAVNLADVTIPPSVIELVPESVARENVIIPLSQENGSLKIILSDPPILTRCKSYNSSSTKKSCRSSRPVSRSSRPSTGIMVRRKRSPSTR